MKARMYFGLDKDGDFELFDKGGELIEWFCRERTLPFLPFLKHLRRGKKTVDMELVPIAASKVSEWEVVLYRDRPWWRYDFLSGKTWLRTLCGKSLFNELYPNIKESRYYGVVFHY